MDKPGSKLQIYLGQVLILTSMFAVNFMARTILAPLLPIIENDLGVSHAEAGSLFLLISAGFFISIIGSSFITSIITHKRTIFLSFLTLGLAMLITSRTQGLWGIRLALVFVGVAAGPYLPSGIATLTTLVHKRHWGKVLAIHELAPNLGLTLGPLIAEAVLSGFTWRTTFIFLGLSAIVMAGIFGIFSRGGKFCGETPSIDSYRKIWANPTFWILVVLFGLGIGSIFGIFSMLPLYLVTEHGLERNWANTLISISRIASLGVVLLGGWATDRYGSRKILTLVLAITGGLTLGLGIAPTAWVAVLIFLQPTVGACFFPPALSALSNVSSPQERNLIVSLTIPLSYTIGAGVFPTLIGLIGDLKSIGWGIALVGALTAAGALLPRHLKFYDQDEYSQNTC
jgi:NNP family nitrate/nitrite transporter-like MFS transporter